MELIPMERIIKIIFLFIIIALFSCEEKGFITDCGECTSNEPINTVIKAELDSDYHTGALVMVWEGRVEDKILFDSVKVFTSSYEKMVSINKTYTITATYNINNKEYTAIDSATPRVRYTEDRCEEPCYFVYDREYNLKLKYTK